MRDRKGRANSQIYETILVIIANNALVADCTSGQSKRASELCLTI